MTAVASPYGPTQFAAAISATASGGIVTCPACNVSFGSAVSISGKSLTIQGAGIGQSIITDATSSGAFTIDGSATNFIRLAGFTIIANGSHTSSGLVNATSTQQQVGFRIDHNRFLIGSAVSRGIVIDYGYGLIDNNTFDITAGSGSVQNISIWGSLDGSDGGFTPWTWPLTLGTPNAVYIEDNVFTNATQEEDCIDAYGGARLVIRHNTFNQSAIGFHGTDSGDRRSLHSFEIYSNSFVNNGSTTRRAATIRGGTGVIYSNTYTGSRPWYDITLMYYRACPPLDQSGWGTCNGTLWKLGSTNLSNQGSRTCSTGGSVGFHTVNCETLGTWGGSYQRFFDGPGANGYPGRDQPGISTGQIVTPIYVWSNGKDAGTYDGGSPPPGGIEAWVQSGRDYINNGSTPKPGYAAYAYPHPLQGSGTPPTGTPVLSVR